MADIAADVTGRTKDVSKSGCEGGKEGFREEQVGFGDAFESKKIRSTRLQDVNNAAGV